MFHHDHKEPEVRKLTVHEELRAAIPDADAPLEEVAIALLRLIVSHTGAELWDGEDQWDYREAVFQKLSQKEDPDPGPARDHQQLYYVAMEAWNLLESRNLMATIGHGFGGFVTRRGREVAASPDAVSLLSSR